MFSPLSLFGGAIYIKGWMDGWMDGCIDEWREKVGVVVYTLYIE